MNVHQGKRNGVPDGIQRGKNTKRITSIEVDDDIVCFAEIFTNPAASIK